MTDPDQPLSRRAKREAEAAAQEPAPTEAIDPAPTQRIEPDVTQLLPRSATDATEFIAHPVTGATQVIAHPEPEPAAAATAPTGFAAFLKRYPRAVLATALSLVFVLAGTGAVFGGIALGDAQATPAPTVEPEPEPEPEREPEPRAVPEEFTDPTRLRTCTIGDVTADTRLGEFSGSVVNATTGDVLFDREAEVGQPAASAMKVLTAAAALSALGPDYRLTTRVVAGSTPGSIVLIGGGDVTLSALPPGQESIYPGAPKMADLAAQTLTAYAEAFPDAPEITEIILDSSYFPDGDRWDSSWSRELQTIGYAAEVTALQVDADRANPSVPTSPRSTNPGQRAGEAFATALVGAGNPVRPTLSTGVAASETALAQVQSQPVSTLIRQMMPNSDNSLAETLGRVISRHIGLDGSSASLNQAITGSLAAYGVPTAGIAVRDASGLSNLNAIPPGYMAQLFQVIHAGENSLEVITENLPVSGRTGTLANRFYGPNAIAAGAVTAKTGWIDNVYTLSGLVTAADGSVLSFALYALGPVNDSAREALDTVTTAVFSCGDNLSNN